MEWRLALQWLGIALIASGCATGGGAPAGGASAGGASTAGGTSQDGEGRCVQTGGRWNAVLAACERGAGGGGGY